MIDIHSHILPGVDDGAESLKESLTIAEMAAADGLKGIVATPHFMEEGYRMSVQEIIERVTELQKELDIQGINLRIYPGAEVFIYPGLARDLEQGLVPTINGGKYILLELPMGEFPVYTDDTLYELKVMGYRPVICHPERYRQVMEDPNILYTWLKEGIYAQVNASSLIGIFGGRVKQTAEILVEHNMVQLIGSDLHSLNKRNECLIDGLARMRQLTGNNVDIIINNNQRLVDNQDLEIIQPAFYQEKKGLINIFKKFFLPQTN